MSSKGGHPNKEKKGFKKHQSKQLIAREIEVRELASCKSRIQSEYKLFTTLNPQRFSTALQLKNEPKLVKLDSEFASTAKNNNNNKNKTQTQEFKSADTISADTLRHFNNLPISTRTKKALNDNGYKQCTRVQHATLPATLANQDIFALSCTGSGKTLAFVIPVLETLWKQRWTRDLGLGALIIEPTRELALQTFHVLRRIGHYHDLSAGLLIGGTSFEEEQRAIAGMNILVCTPGRLIHHLEQSYGLDLTNIVSLVIDECDHLLDIGFEEQFKTISPLLPSKQKLQQYMSKDENSNTKIKGNVGFHSMLFSATNSPQVTKFAKKVLSEDVQMISMVGASGNQPDNLQHRFLVVPETQKVQTLYEFLRIHFSNKTVVFVSTARQATYLYELFRGLGIKAPVHRLHSKLGSQSRTQEYYQFQQEQFGVLICTDIAARGLDLTGVSWVVHFDPPTSITQYTHRSGRTARLKGKGTNLLMLTPSQKDLPRMLYLMNSQLQIQQVGLPSFRTDFYSKLAEYYSQHPAVKTHAEKAVISYMQHILHEKGEFKQKILQSTTKEKARALLEAPCDPLNNAYSRDPSAVVSRKLFVDDDSSVVLSVFYSIFDIKAYDMIGLCRGYGLQSAPVIIDDDDEDQEEEKDVMDAQKAAALKMAEKAKKEKKSQKSKSSHDDDDNVDQELAAITRVNPELEEFIKRQRLLAKANAVENNSLDQTIFRPSKQQPTPLAQPLNTTTDKNRDDIVCDYFHTWSDSDGEDDKQQPLDFTPDNSIFEQLKKKYQQVDLQDKQYVKDTAVKRRRFKQNMIKLDRLRRLGYNITMEQLEDMLEQKKQGKQTNMEAYRGMGDESDDDGDDQEVDDILAGLGHSDDDVDDDDDENEGVSFGIGGDDDDDDDSDSDGGNEFHQLMKKQALLDSQKKHNNTKPQQITKNLLNESSDDDDDSDEDDVRAPLPAKVQANTKKPLVQKNTKQSTSSLMGFDSDDGSDSDSINARTKASVSAKQAFSLDETSDDSSEDEPTPPPSVATTKAAKAPTQPAQKLSKEEKKAQEIALRREKNRIAKDARLKKEQRDFESKRINLNETDSDDDEEDNKKKAPAPVKKFLNLETSSDDDSGDDSDDDVASIAAKKVTEPVVINKNGKRTAPTQLQPKKSTAPAAPTNTAKTRSQLKKA